MKDKFLKWLLVFVVAISTFNFSFLKDTQTASAHDVYFISVLINPNSYEYQGFVLHDKESAMSKESKHTEYSLGDFRDVGQNATIPGEVKEKKYIEGKPPMYFSFPAYEQGDLPGGKAKNHASSVDYDRADVVAKTIVGGLNGAMQVVYEGEKASSYDELRKRTNAVLSAVNGNGSVNGWKFRKGRIVEQKMTEDGLRNDDWVTISKDGQEYEFPYRIMKGYKLPSGVTSGQLSWHEGLVGDHSYSDDVVYITWSRVAYQAWYSMDVNGHSSNHLNEIRRVGKLEEAVVELAESALRQLRDLLGLYSMNELVYNEGIRGSNFWYYGVMPDAWADNMNKYYNLFQGIAWTLIIFALAKLLIQRNLSIVNPAMRVSLMEGVQDLVITALALVFLMPLMNFVLTMNYRLVDVFATLKTHGDVFSEVNNYSGAIGGILLQLFYFFIEIWLNFTYIIRGITLAIMMMMAPLFVVSISLGGKWKNLFGTFCREFVGHVFIQSFHAMIIAFLLSTSVMTRGIETAVTLFAMIALTNFFRAMVFGQGGDFAGKMGVSSAAGMVALGASTAKAASNQRKQSSAKRSQSSSSSSSTDGGDRNADGSVNVGGGNSFSATSRNNQAAATMSVSGSGPGGEGGQSGNVSTVPNGMGMSSGEPDSGADSGMDTGGSLANEGFAVGHNPKTSRAAVGGALATGAGIGYVGAKLMGSAAYGMAFGSEQGPQAFNRFHSGSEKPNLPPGKRTGGRGGSGGGAPGQGGASTSTAGPVNPAMDGGYSLQPDNEMNVGESNGGSLESGGIRSYTVSGGGDSANIEYDGGWMSERGITGGETTAQGHTTLNYSQDSMNEEQIADANYYAEVFEKGNEKEIRALRENGIQSARKKADGSYAITYNQTGKEKMGFKSLEKQNDGHYRMNRSVEQTGSAPHLFLKRYRPPQEQQPNKEEDEGIPRV